MTRPASLWLLHSCPADHLKRTNSDSSTKKIRLTSVTNSHAAAHKSWVARCFSRTPGFSFNSFHNFHGISHSTPSLVTTRISHFLLHFQVFNPLNKLLKTSVHISLQLWIHASKVLPHNPHLRLERSVHLKNVKNFFLIFLFPLKRFFQGVFSCFEILTGSA